LFRLKTNKEERWIYSDAERDAALKELKDKRVDVQRYKGLGEMNSEQLWETTMNPATRTLLQVNVEDAAKSDQIFQVLMGDEVARARHLSLPNAQYVKNLDV